MSSESKEPTDLPKSERLPFEPAQTRKKSVQKADSQKADSKPAAAKGKKKPATKKSSSERLNSSQVEKSAAKPSVTKSSTDRSTTKPLKTSKETSKERRRSTPDQLGIPKVVSDRMARRMLAFCALPTLLGMLTFVVSYFVVTNGWFKLPNVVVLLVSMGWLGLGVIGLSYGILSASWDEERVGTRLGYEEFSTNFGRLRTAWRESKGKTTIGD